MRKSKDNKCLDNVLVGAKSLTGCCDEDQARRRKADCEGQRLVGLELERDDEQQEQQREREHGLESDGRNLEQDGQVLFGLQKRKRWALREDSAGD